MYFSHNLKNWFFLINNYNNVWQCSYTTGDFVHTVHWSIQSVLLLNPNSPQPQQSIVGAVFLVSDHGWTFHHNRSMEPFSWRLILGKCLVQGQLVYSLYTNRSVWYVVITEELSFTRINREWWEIIIHHAFLPNRYLH